MGIQAIKGVEVGDGFQSARRRGSEAHDEIDFIEGKAKRRTDRAGGTEGGISNGEILRVRAAMTTKSTIKIQRGSYSVYSRRSWTSLRIS